MLLKAMEAKVQLTETEETQFTNFSKELDEINKNIARFEAINKGKLEVGAPASSAVVTTSDAKKKFSNCSVEYGRGFWKALSNGSLKDGTFRNAALGEGGTAADGSYLVPSQTDPTIPALATIETAARRLSFVMPTEMDIKLPYQSAKTVAAAKSESTNSGTNAFATNVPQFNTTTLSAFNAGDSVYISWELLQDVSALSAFVTADLNRAVFNYEEDKFVNGSGSGEPLGYLNGVATPRSASLSIGAVLDLTGDLRQAYYSNAKFLANRQTIIALYKTQIATSQFQNFIQYGANGSATLLGWPVEFSSQMPVYSASPAVSGSFKDSNSTRSMSSSHPALRARRLSARTSARRWVSLRWSSTMTGT